MANMSYNLLGYLPAPTIYGWANGENLKSRAGMTMILSMSIPSVSLIAIVIMIRKFKKIQKEPAHHDDEDLEFIPAYKKYNTSLGPEPSLIGVGITENFNGRADSDIDTKTALGLQYASYHSNRSHHSKSRQTRSENSNKNRASSR